MNGARERKQPASLDRVRSLLLKRTALAKVSKELRERSSTFNSDAARGLEVVKLAQQVSRAKAHIKLLEEKLEEQQSCLQASKERVQRLNVLVSQRRMQLQDASGQLSEQVGMAAIRMSSAFSANVLEGINAEQRRLRAKHVGELLEIYPILPNWGMLTGDRPLYSIRGLLVPNSEWPFGWDLEKVATALSYAAILVNLLAAYLEIPLRYPIYWLGTRSTIYDFLDTRWNPEAPAPVNQYTLGQDMRLLGHNEFPLFQPPSFQMLTDWWARFRSASRARGDTVSNNVEATPAELRRAGSVASVSAVSSDRALTESAGQEYLSRGQYLARKVRERRLASSNCSGSIRSTTSRVQPSINSPIVADSFSGSVPLLAADERFGDGVAQKSAPKEAQLPSAKPLSKNSQLDYGVFYLNKNIEQLCDAVNVQVVHLRNTLPNLLLCMEQVIHLAEL